jgi:hypothetical protein
MSEPQALQLVNFTNLISYILNFAVTYGVNASGKFPSNGELSLKYQTLVTPSGYAFAIWGIIFTSQLIWTCVQLLPKYRAKVEVIHGVAYYYVWACAAQCAWTVVFTMEHITFSLIAMVSILIPLLIILTRTSQISSESIVAYWLLKFPFEIHVGWIMAATLVNCNVLLVAQDVPTTAQIASAWVSLAMLATTAMYYIIKTKWVVPTVLAWASYAIKVELSNPRDSITGKFTEESIKSLEVAAGVLSGFILVAAAVKFLHVHYRHMSTIDTSTTSSQASQSLREPLTQA